MIGSHFPALYAMYLVQESPRTIVFADDIVIYSRGDQYVDRDLPVDLQGSIGRSHDDKIRSSLFVSSARLLCIWFVCLAPRGDIVMN